MTPSLLPALSLRNGISKVWIESGGAGPSVAEIVDRVHRLRARLHFLQGKNVMLRCQERSALLWGLLALDGFCSALLLIHPESTDAEVDLFKQEFAAEAVLTDDHFALLSADPEGRGVETGERETTWVIPTSGTTGTPKLIAHSVRFLCRTVKPTPVNGTPLRWGLLYGVTRFAGLQVVLQCLVGGGTLLVPSDGAAFDRQIDFLAAQGCDALSATPTMWRKILMSPAAGQMGLRQITLGGEIADQKVLDSLRESFPAARICHIYASTEVGVCFTVKDGRAGFPASWLENGSGGAALEVRGGVLWVRASGERPLATVKSAMARDDRGFIDTGDRVEVSGDRVYFLGRDNGTINVGGNKVSPEEIELVLLSHPMVLLARARGYQNAFSGQVVVAEVLLREYPADRHEEWRRKLQVWCRERLEPFKVPARISIVQSLEVGDSGKLARRA